MRLRNCDLPVLFLLAYSLQSVICTDQEGPTQAEGNINGEDNGVNVTTETLIQLLNQTEIIAEPNFNGATGEISIADQALNESSTNQTTASSNESKLKLNCTPIFRDESNMTSQLVLVNVSTISNYLQLKAMIPSLEIGSSQAPATNQSTGTQLPGQCTVIVFYLDWCPFSAKAAAHFNALGRLFPQLNILAIEAYSVYSTTMRYGVVGVPSAYLFHSNKLISRFNKSEVTIEQLVQYVNRFTSLEPVGEVNITEADRLGPLSSQVAYTFNYTFIGSWAFCILVGFYYFSRSELFRRAKEHIYNMWNEAQFQHEHID